MKSYFEQNKHKTNEWALSFPGKSNLSKTQCLSSGVLKFPINRQHAQAEHWGTQFNVLTGRPCDPAGPCGPVSPLCPWGPSGPRGPVGPASP